MTEFEFGALRVFEKENCSALWNREQRERIICHESVRIIFQARTMAWLGLG
jgi:hypothetical protein